jgi:hypothetical protein
MMVVSTAAKLFHVSAFELVADLYDCVDGRDEFATERRQGVFDRRRRSRYDPAQENAVVHEFLQACRKDLGRHAWNGLGSARRYQIILGVQAPPSTRMHCEMGQPSGGIEDLFFRRFTAIGHAPCL